MAVKEEADGDSEGCFGNREIELSELTTTIRLESPRREVVATAAEAAAAGREGKGKKNIDGDGGGSNAEDGDPLRRRIRKEEYFPNANCSYSIRGPSNR